MTDWLDDFANSSVAKRVVFANYLEHLRLKNENSRQQGLYASVEDALQDFAKRTGLNDMQKRALRRQMFVKTALDFSKVKLERDRQMIQNNDAPASVLPGVKPGSDLAETIEKQKGKKPRKDRRLTPESQQNDRFIEDTLTTEMPDSGDDGQIDMNIGDVSQVAGEIQPGIIIEAAEEENPFAAFEEQKPTTAPSSKVVFPKKEKSKKIELTSKESKLRKRIFEINQQIDSLKREVGPDPENERWLTRQRLEGERDKVQKELNKILSEKEEKSKVKTPQNKAEQNDTKFLSEVDKILKLKKYTSEERAEAVEKLSSEGLQDVFERAMQRFHKEIFYKPSQGHNKEQGDYVECMVCKEDGNHWVNRQNPALLPFWHLNVHADRLLALSGVDIDTEAKSSQYRTEIVNAYLTKYPGAALEGREQELASVLEKEVASSSKKALTEPPHVSTDAEKNAEYTDQVLNDMVKYQLTRFGVDLGDKDIDELTKETSENIKMRLEDEFPEAFPEEGDRYPEIGKLTSRNIPFMAFHKAFREEVGALIQEYRGTTLKTKAPTRRNKRRWTGTERRERIQQQQKMLRKEDIIQELIAKLGRHPSDKEIREEMEKRDMIPVSISLTGDRGCWNCKQKHIVWVRNKREAINSVVCPNCNAFREVLASNVSVKEEGEAWTCRECNQVKHVVIRDPNVANTSASKTYLVYCDEDYINGGAKALGNSRYVHTLKKSEKQVEVPILEEIYETMKVGDMVSSPDHGEGKIAYKEGAQVWIDFKEHKTAKMKDLKDEVIFLKPKRERWKGFCKVVEVILDATPPAASGPALTTPAEQKRQITLLLRANDGRLFTLRYDAKESEKDVPIMTEMSLKDLKKIETAKSRRIHRSAMMVRIGTKDCPYHESVVVYRIENKPVKTTSSRQENLIRRLRRAKMLQKIKNGVKK